MNRRKRTPEQIIRKLRRAETRLAEGATVAEVCRKLGVSEATYHRWNRRYGAISEDQRKRLKELERENSRLTSTKSSPRSSRSTTSALP